MDFLEYAVRVSFDYKNCTIFVKYLSKRPNSNNWYFIRRIPDDLFQHYAHKKDKRIVTSTKTDNKSEAAKRALRLNNDLEKEWQVLRGGNVTPSADNIAKARAILDRHGLPYSKASKPDSDAFSRLIEEMEDAPSISDKNALHEAYMRGVPEDYQSTFRHIHSEEHRLALDIANGRSEWTASLMRAEYLNLKGWSNSRKEINNTNPAFELLIGELGDRTPKEYKNIEVLELIKKMQQQALKTSTIRRRLGRIRAVFNFVARMHDLHDELSHPFTNFDIPGFGDDKIERPDFTQEQLGLLRAKVEGSNDAISGLIAIMMETGLRVSEACGLHKRDLHNLDAPSPFLTLHRNPNRPLKTKSSQRFVPLVGVAYNYAKSVETTWLFPKYVDQLASKIKNDSASAAVNKRLKAWLGDDAPTSHSFRHTFSTRLRDVSCPEDIRQELGGWASSVSQRYGSPTDINLKHEYLIKSLSWSDSGWMRS